VLTEKQLAQSRTIIERGSKSFAIASRLFDRETRQDATLLYAWCRHCDDVIDGQELGMGPLRYDQSKAADELAGLRQLTLDALKGKTMSNPFFAGLQHVVERHDIPDEYPLALIDGFAMDVAKRRYETLDDTLEYAYHVAGVVGIMMAMIIGARDKNSLRYASDLGIAFQLTNIARDVYDDARGERIYLPASWLRQAGVPDGIYALREYPQATFSVVRRLLEAAEPYYASARWGLPSLGFRSAWAVAVAHRTYRRIGIEVLRQGAQGLSQRAVVSHKDRLKSAMQSLFVASRAVTWDRWLGGRAPLS